MFVSRSPEEGASHLYSKVQTVFLKSALEESQRKVRVSVELTSSLSNVTKQALNLQVTDDEDPYFLYCLLITEEDYQNLKTAQGLLIDFHNFPAQLVRLLDQCTSENGKPGAFLLFLEEEKTPQGPRSYLQVVETNNFKHLCHLTLSVELGGDIEVKKLMLRKIKGLKEKVAKDEKKIVELEGQLSSQTKVLEEKSLELLRKDSQWKEERLSMREEATKELEREIDKLRSSHEEWRARKQEEKTQAEEALRKTLNEKDNEISRLTLETNILMEKHTHSESVMKEQSKKIDALDKELTSAKWDLSSMKKQSHKLDTDYHEREKAIHSLKTRIAVLEQEVKDKVILIAKQQDFLSLSNEKVTKLEEALQERERSLQKKQTALVSVSDELVKANEIITKLQKELAVASSKLKVRTGIALEQEKVVETTQKRITELERSLTEKSVKIQDLIESELTLRTTLKDLELKLGAKEKTIQDNERMIDWLNRRVNEQYRPGAPSLTSTPFLRNTSQDSKDQSSPGIGDVNISKLDQLPNTGVILKESSNREEVSKGTPLSSNPSKSDKPKRAPAFKRNTVNTVPSSYFLK